MSVFLKADLEQTLKDGGFASETVSSGEEALKIYEGRHQEYDALGGLFRFTMSLQGTQSV